MKKEELFQAMAEIDDSFLDENVTEIKHSPWISVVIGAAACVAVTVGVLYALPKPMTDEISMEKITVQNTETTQTETVTEAVPLADKPIETEIPDYRLYIAIPTDFPEGRSVYDTYCLEDNEENWPIFAEIEIDEALGHVSLMTAYDSNSLPHVGNLVKTDTGYDCQINGTEFMLEYYEAPLECLAEPLEESEMPLIFRAENHPLDGMIFTSQITPYQPFADIQPEDIQTVFSQDSTETTEISYGEIETWPLHENEIPDSVSEILRNVKIYAKTLCHEKENYLLQIEFKDGTVHRIEPTTSYLVIDGYRYHTDTETLKKLSECRQIIKDAVDEKLSHIDIKENRETICIDSDTAQTTTSSAVTTAKENFNSTRIARETFEGETFPEQTETVTIYTDDITPATEPPQQTEPELTQPPEIPSETIVTTIDDIPPVADADEIPPEVLNILTEIEPTQGIYKEMYLSWALTYYPNTPYAVQIHMHTGTDSTPEEKQLLLQELGLNVTGIFEYDRIQAIVTSTDLDMLDSHKEYGFLIDLLPCSTEEIQPTEAIPDMTEVDGVVYTEIMDSF